MRKNIGFLASFIVFAAALYPISASAVLGFNEKSGLEARGGVDLDSFGPNPALSQLAQTEIVLPFTRSFVRVADSQSGAFGTFDYSSAADIGLLELKLFGSLTNSTASSFFGNGVPILSVTSQVLDVVTLNSTLGVPFDVTLELVVSGSITDSGGGNLLNPFANGSLKFGLDPGSNASDSAAYPIGAINDTLSVTRTVSGSTINMDFDAFLSFSVFEVVPGATVTGQLSNTALLKLILPAGVTVAGSGSGTFGAVIPVPEPESYALMLCGLALVGFAARRRQRV